MGLTSTQLNKEAGYLNSVGAVSAREQSSGRKYLAGESGEIAIVDISCIHSQHSHTDQRKGLPFLCTSLLGEGDLTIFLRSETFGLKT